MCARKAFQILTFYKHLKKNMMENINLTPDSLTFKRSNATSSSHLKDSSDRRFYSLPEDYSLNKTQETTESATLLNEIYTNISSRGATFDGPFGFRPVIYCDYAASGQSLNFIEDYIRKKVLPFYGNTHTTITATSLQSTYFRHEAKDIIRKAVNASENDAVFFTGNGSTSSVSKLIHMLNIKTPIVVFVGPYEHHSNLLPWREINAKETLVIMGKNYKVLNAWFQKKDGTGQLYSSWCKKVSEDEVLCFVCNKRIACAAKGWAALTQHETTNCHKNAISIKLSQSQLLLQPRVSIQDSSPVIKAIELCHSREEATKAELIWSLKLVKGNIATSFADDTTKVFETMFGTIPTGFSLGRTKFSYLITEALGPHFRDELLLAARKSYYTLLYDETINNAGKKELQVMLRFWSEDDNKVECRYLCSTFLGHATANVIFQEILDIMTKYDLPLSNILMLSSDGPNVNKKVFRLMNDHLIKIRGQGLVNVGTCNLHTVNNAFQKGLEEYGESVCELLVDIYYFFKKNPSRWEDFELAQEKKAVPQHTFLKHVSSRWLTAGPACERLLEQWEAVKEYFLVFVPNRDKKIMKSTKYKRITSTLKETGILVEANFVIESFNVFEKFVVLFQSSHPLVHGLYTELSSILKIIKGRVCKPGTETNDEISSVNLRRASDIRLSDNTLKYLNVLGEKDKVALCYKIQRHYMAAHNYLMKKFLNHILECCQCLQPSLIAAQQSIDRIGTLAEAFAFIGVKQMDVQDEWKILQSEVPKSENQPIDAYWYIILCRKNAFGANKYPALAKLIKSILCLSHGNADVERGFSVSRNVLSEDKCRMSERVLDYRLIIKDALKKYTSVTDVPISKELLLKAMHAHKAHINYLEEQKKIKEQREKEKLQKEDELKKEKEMSEKLENKKQSIDKLESKVKAVALEKKEVRESALCLLKEANKSLKDAISKNDLKAVRVAQGMLEGAEKLREQEKSHEEQEAKLNKIVNKRKKSIIDAFINKKPKLNP